MAPFCKDIKQYHNQDIGIDTISLSYLDFPICTYFCVYVFSIKTKVSLYIHHHSQGSEQYN